MKSTAITAIMVAAITATSLVVFQTENTPASAQGPVRKMIEKLRADEGKSLIYYR